MTEKLGDVLRDLMAARDLQGVDVCAAIDLSENALSSILNKPTKPRYNTFVKLRNLLAKTPEEKARLIAAYEGEEYQEPDTSAGIAAQIEEERTSVVEQKRAEDYLDAKANSIAFRRDIADELTKAKIPVIPEFTFEHMGKKAVCDFMTRSSKNRIAIEAKYNLHRDWDHTLGTCIMLRKGTNAKAVVVVVPYYNQVALDAKKYFLEEDIHVVRVDELVTLLKKLGA